MPLLALIGSDVTRCDVMIETIRSLGSRQEPDACDMLGAIGEIDNCIANELPPDPRLKALAAVAARLAELQQPGRAVALALRVIEAAENPGQSEAKSRCQSAIAQSLTGTGQTDRALDVAQAALGTARTTPDAILPAVDAVRALACVGRFDEAESALDAIGDEWKNKSFARRDVAIAMAMAGDAVRAVELINRIAHRPVKAQALIAIAARELESNATGEAAHLAAQALDLLYGPEQAAEAGKKNEQFSMGEFVETGPAPWKALRILCKAGKAPAANALVRGFADPEHADLGAALDTALGLFVVGSDGALAIAERRLAQAPLLVHSNDDLVIAWGRAGILEVLAGRIERVADIARTLLLTAAGGETPDQINESVRFNAVLEIVRVCEEEGHADWAAQLLDLALAHVRQLPDVSLCVRCGGQIVAAYVRIGLPGPATSLWDELLTRAQSSGRLAVFDLVRFGAPLLARRDDGRTLWRAFQTMQDIESWWKMPAAPERL